MKLKTTFLLCWLLAGLVLAASVGADELYDVEVKVADESPQARNQGLRNGLGRLVERLSGSTQVMQRPGVDGVLAQAADLVQQYRYRYEEPTEVDQPGQRYLWARFDKPAVDRAMRQAGIPVWAGQRPRVLLWLGLERKGKRSLLSLENDPRSRGILLGTARERGMPLLFPLHDLQDQSKLSAADLWAEYQAAVEEASARYPHDVILTGRLRQTGGNWHASWTLWGQGKEDRFEEHGLDWAAALRLGIHAAQDLLAQRYAPVADGSAQEPLRIRINGVFTQGDYGRVMQQLRSLEIVRQLAVYGAESNSLILLVQAAGGAETLARTLSLGGVLLRTTEPAQFPSAGTEELTVPVLSEEPVDLSFELQP